MIADIAYRQVNGWHGEIDLYLPERPGPHPVILYLHGGGWRFGSRTAAAVHAPAWCAMGLAVAAPSYRLVETAPAPAALEDAHAACDWIAEHGAECGLDPDDWIIGGHSAGATMALAVAYTRQAAPRAVVAWSAHADLQAYRIERELAGDPVEWLAASVDPEAMARAVSPLELAAETAPPTLLIHSDNDPRVPHEAALRLSEKLTHLGIVNELVSIRSDYHLPSEHPTGEVERAHARTHRFLRKAGLAREAA